MALSSPRILRSLCGLVSCCVLLSTLGCHDAPRARAAAPYGSSFSSFDSSGAGVVVEMNDGTRLKWRVRSDSRRKVYDASHRPLGFVQFESGEMGRKVTAVDLDGGERFVLKEEVETGRIRIGEVFSLEATAQEWIFYDSRRLVLGSIGDDGEALFFSPGRSPGREGSVLVTSGEDGMGAIAREIGGERVASVGSGGSARELLAYTIRHEHFGPMERAALALYLDRVPLFDSSWETRDDEEGR